MSIKHWTAYNNERRNPQLQAINTMIRPDIRVKPIPIDKSKPVVMRRVKRVPTKKV
jgi:hypothetical protein